jgi:hypothetical protein
VRLAFIGATFRCNAFGCDWSIATDFSLGNATQICDRFLSKEQKLVRIESLRIEARSVLTDTDCGGDALDSFLADLVDPVAVRQRVGNTPRQDASYAVCSRDLLHSRRYVDRVAVDADRALRVTLLAHHHVATVDPDPKTRDGIE